MGRLLIGLCFSLVLCVPVHAQTIDTVCAPQLELLPEQLDLAVEGVRIAALESSGDPRLLTLSCQAWGYARRRDGPQAPDTLRMTGRVAASLVWLGRSPEAQAIALPLYDALLAAKPPMTAEAGPVAGLLSFTYVQREQLDAAMRWSQRGIDHLWASSKGAADDAEAAANLRNVRMNHATLLSKARQYPAAEALLKTLLKEFDGHPELAETKAAALRALSVLARRQDKLDQALAYTRDELALRQAELAANTVELATATQNLALLLIASAHYDEAEQQLLAALQIARAPGAKIDFFGHLSSIRDTYSGLLLARGRPAEALRIAQDSVDLMQARPEGSSARMARPLRRLAEAQMALGEFGPAMQTWRRALALLDQAAASGKGKGDRETNVAVYLGYGNTLLALGGVDDADAASARALQAPEGAVSSPTEQSALLLLRARVLERRSDRAGALQALRDADAALAASLAVDHPQRAQIKARLCRLEPADCDALLPSLSGAAVAAQNPEVLAAIALALAQDARRRGDHGLAQSRAVLALHAAQGSGLPDLQWQAYDELAQGMAAVGRSSEAILFGKQALIGLQSLRARVLPLGGAAEQRYLADKGETYRRLAACLLADGRFAEGLDVLRLLKLSEQHDFEERSATQAALANELPQLTPAEQALMRPLARAFAAQRLQAEEIARLRLLQAAQRITAEELARLSSLQREHAAVFDLSLGTLDEALSSVNQAARAPAKPGLVLALARLPRPRVATDVHVHAVLGAQQLSLFMLSQRGQQLRQLPLGSAALASEIAALLDGIQQRGEVRAASQALYRRLALPIDQFAQAQGARRIVLWLDGALRYLPLGVLHDGQRYLAQKYELVLAAPSLSAAAPPSVRAARLQAFGLTRAIDGMAALPGVGEELCGIVNGPVRGIDQATLGCRDAVGSGPLDGQADANEFFTEQSLRQAGEGGQGAPTLLHIGTHFVLRPGDMSRSWLLLGDGQRLSLGALRSVPLVAKSLVMLSACQTGVPGASANGVEVDGLSATLMGSGAARVIASLWRVDDRRTAPLMRRFYQALAARPNDYAAALRQAQQAAIADPSSHPYDWAAFNLVERVE